MVERYERKHLIVGSVLFMAVFGVLFAFTETASLILVAGFLVSSASNLFSNGFHIYQAEPFPTRVRGTAVGAAYSLSRASGAILPFISVSRPDHLGPTAVFIGSAGS